MENPQKHKAWHINVDSSGRVLLPAELRRALNAQPGTELVWISDADGIHLKSFEDTLAEIQAYYKSLGPEGAVWSEELIKQRRIEASHE